MYQVIIVDDEPRILEGIIHLFPWNNFGFEVVASFTNGKEALEYINAHPQVDIVMTDIQMPVMNGLEATHRIRESARDDLRALPIVVLSANAFTEDVQESKRAGADDHLSKPISIKDLAATLGGILGRA